MARQGSGEARQYSFTMGEISPEKYFTPNEVAYQQGLAKAENVIVKASGGISTRAGTVYDNTLDSFVDAEDAQGPHEIKFQHPVTKAKVSLTFLPYTTKTILGEVQVWYKLLLNGQDIMPEIARKDYSGFGDFSISSDYAGIHIPKDITLSFSMTSEYLIITPSLRMYSSSFEAFTDTTYFGEVDGYFFTETVLGIAFSKPFNYSGYTTHANGMRIISNFGGQLVTPSKLTGTQVKVTASGAGTVPAISARVSYLITATRKDGTEEIYMGIRSADDASDNITSVLNIVSRQGIDVTSTGPLYYPDSTYRTSLKIENIWLHKNLTGIPKYKYFSIYRAIENDPNYVATFSLVNRFPVYKTSSDTFTINFTDYGESDPSITPPMDRTFFIENPSVIELDAEKGMSTYSPNKVVSSAMYQARAFMALQKSSVFDNEATTGNTILASKLNAPEQFAIPLISNPAEAFSFQVPEESGGYLTHLAASAKLIAFTNKSVFVYMGDEAGTLTPLALNPVKVFQVGAKAEVAPCTFGEYTFFAMEGVPSIGFIRISSQGEVAYGDALPISRHILEEKGDSIVSMKILNGPDSSQIRAQILTARNKIIELTGTDGIFGLSRVLHWPDSSLVPVSLIENKYPLTYGLTDYVGGAFYRRIGSGNKYIRLPYINLSVSNSSSKLFNPYVDFSAREGVFDSGVSWTTSPINIPYTPDTPGYFLANTFQGEVSFDAGNADWSAGAGIIVNLQEDITGNDLIFFNQYAEAQRTFALKFYLMDEYGSEYYITGEITGLGALGPYTLTFPEEVPEIFRTKIFKLYCFREEYSNFESESYKKGDTGVVVLSTNKLIVPATFNNSYFEAIAEAKGLSVSDGTEISIGLFGDGEVISDMTDDVIKAVYSGNEMDGFYWTVDFGGGFLSTINLGIPYESEVHTLPVEVAVGQGDSISDAGKLISGVAVSVYRTDSLMVGEVGQSDEYLEDVDFTTIENPQGPVKFNGVKEYNFPASWNKHGMVRLKSKPFRAFSISSITPKGNVSV